MRTKRPEFLVLLTLSWMSIAAQVAAQQPKPSLTELEITDKVRIAIARLPTTVRST